MIATGATFETVEVGVFGAGKFIPCDALYPGYVGYITVGGVTYFCDPANGGEATRVN